MFKKLIEKHKQKKIEEQRNKNNIPIKSLLIGEIVLYKNRKNVGLGKVDHYYNEVKKYAILVEIGYQHYLHIKSNQKLYEMGSYNSIIGDYAVTNIRKFEEVLPMYMRENNLTSSSKISQVDIEQIEHILNNFMAKNIEVPDLFK